MEIAVIVTEGDTLEEVREIIGVNQIFALNNIFLLDITTACLFH